MALTNVVFTEQEALGSHIRVKYLLFISAKAKKGKSKRQEEAKGREKVGVIKKERERGKLALGYGDIARRSMTTEQEDSEPFRLLFPANNATCQVRNCIVRRCSCVMT